jgi:hypothetical protein
LFQANGPTHAAVNAAYETLLPLQFHEDLVLYVMNYSGLVDPRAIVENIVEVGLLALGSKQERTIAVVHDPCSSDMPPSPARVFLPFKLGVWLAGDMVQVQSRVQVPASGSGPSTSQVGAASRDKSTSSHG